MTARILRLVSASALVLLGACQGAGPVYRTYYVPEDGTIDATALVREAEPRCAEQANADAENAYDRTYRNAEVNVNVPGPSAGGSALVMPGSQSQARVASRMASVQAYQVRQAAWDEAMKTCMAEAGFHQLSVCVSGCPQ